MTCIIHPSAVVAAGAEFGERVEIGPFCRVDANVKIGDDSKLISHVVVTGHTSIGCRNRIFPFSCIGHEPQDLKYHGEESEVYIGDENTIRENVTINPGTEGGGMLTRIGSNNLLMAYVHIAHDCILGDHIVMANCATLAGHVTIEDHAIIGGMSAIHQFLRVGRMSMIGGMSGIVKDIPPFTLTAGGYRPGLAGLNIIGLKRHGFSHSQVRTLKKVYRILLQGTDNLQQRLIEAKAVAEDDPEVISMITFMKEAKRGVTQHRRETETEK